MDLETAGVPTGFARLDALIGGLHTGELVVLAARPSIGKTVLAMNIAFQAANEEAARVLYFSLDIGGGHFERRLLSYVARLDASVMRHPSRLERDEWTRLMAAAETVRGLPMLIEDSPSSSIWILEDLCRDALSEQPFDLVVIDYLQLLRDGSEQLEPTPSQRKKQIAKMGRRLKALATELSVPVLVLVEIDRRVERRASKRPMLDDLKPAGDVAEIADTVMFLYRDEVYHSATADLGIAEVIVAKEPRGRTGTARLRFEGERLRFGSLADPTLPSTL